MKILITGGLGNLGSWLTEHLLKKGFEVTTFSSRDKSILREYSFNKIFGEIENKNDLKKLFENKKWDAIIHLASVNEGNIPDYPKKALAVNALGTRNLLQLLTDCGQTNTHLIYFSTFHIYGAISGLIEEDKVFPNPKNDYAATHLFAEYYTKQFHFTHKIPYTIFRLTNSYGAPKEIDSSKWYLVLNDLAKMAVEENIIKLKSNGLARRDFVWMGDVCRVVEKCLYKGAANETFNLGSGSSFSILEIAEVVKKAYENLYSSNIEIKKNESDKNLYDEILNVSIKKLQNWINFEPQNKLHEEANAVFDLLEKTSDN